MRKSNPLTVRKDPGLYFKSISERACTVRGAFFVKRFVQVPLERIDVQSGAYSGENGIVRFEETGGRS